MVEFLTTLEKPGRPTDRTGPDLIGDRTRGLGTVGRDSRDRQERTLSYAYSNSWSHLDDFISVVTNAFEPHHCSPPYCLHRQKTVVGYCGGGCGTELLICNRCGRHCTYFCNCEGNNKADWSNVEDHSTLHAIRLRGGTNSGPNPNIRKDLFDIPSLSKSRFFIDGLRSITFIEDTMFPLRNGLAQVTWKDATLLQTVERTDPGGVLGNPRPASGRTTID